MNKRTQYTKITPLPSNVPRQLAVELLHAHREVIELNPLVTGVKPIEAPRDCPNDEYFSQWYEIAEVITWGFGMKKKISFKGVFHDLPYGMQSHTYAPMGVDLRIKYRIGGNQPGEPREARELGVDTPLDGLYLRQDVEITCNLTLASFVKKETKEAIDKMIDRMVKKAELLDEGKLHAMFENGRLKTAKPGATSATDESLGSPPGSPTPSMQSSFSSPRVDKNGFGNYHDVARTASHSQNRNSQYSPGHQTQPSTELPAASNMPIISELPGSYEQPQQHSPSLYPSPLKPQPMSFRSELPGDSSFYTGPSPGHSPLPSPRPANLDVKPPVQYQSHSPPADQHPAERHSIASASGAPTPEQQRASVNSSQTHIAEWQRNVRAGSDTESSYSQSSPTTEQHTNYSRLRPTSSTVPDEQRFSQLSIQQPGHQDITRPMPPPPPPPQQDLSTVKCPVCNLFEGDAAAVNHHVSKAHFS